MLKFQNHVLVSFGLIVPLKKIIIKKIAIRLIELNTILIPDFKSVITRNTSKYIGMAGRPYSAVNTILMFVVCS